MVEPVIAADGFTYDKNGILRWLKTNNNSPMTMQPMQNHDLKPNSELKQQIDLWLAQKGSLEQKPEMKEHFPEKETDTITNIVSHADTDDNVAIEEDN